ncbi:MAG: ATP-binding cassette domain-containing protein [Clostridia bacterium]|nr:ATP-binding cassette domain-containing protein [Clostridia bacterium]
MLELINVSKTFNANTENEKKALTDINLKVDNGDFITIIGSNGAGKSTLFNAISGAFPVDTGKITLDNDDITFLPDFKRAKFIGRLFQDVKTGTAPSMTVEENLMLASGGGHWLSIGGRTEKAALRERVAALGLGLEDRMKTPVGLLSGGQRQAISLLMATLNPPKLLLLDEHTAALDPAAAEKILEVTERTVKEYNLTCLMITHNMSSALSLGNRTIMMTDGRIIFDTKGEERSSLTVDDLLLKFKANSGKALDNDRILLS